METYRFSSKLREHDREYLIQTTNDVNLGSVLMTVYVNGVPAETVTCPHPSEINPQEILSFVKVAHGEKKKEIEKLLQVYREVTTEGNPEMMYHLGTTFFYKGFYEEAKGLFRAVVQLQPTNHQACNFFGMSELALGNPEQAIAAASRAVEQRPGYADYRNNLAEALVASGAADKAIIELEQTLEINMYYADAYFNLGLARIQQEVNNPNRERLAATVKEITDNFNRASLIYANFKGKVFEEGMQALAGYDLVRALSVFKGIREEKKDAHRQEFAAFYMKFVMYPNWVNEKAIADRIAFLKAELAKNPAYVDLSVELAQCYLEQSRMVWKEGMKQLQKTSGINPSLRKISSALEEADDAYGYMARTLNNLTERG